MNCRSEWISAAVYLNEFHASFLSCEKFRSSLVQCWTQREIMDCYSFSQYFPLYYFRKSQNLGEKLSKQLFQEGFYNLQTACFSKLH